MPRAVPGIVALNAGELDPLLHARVDLQKYASACRRMLNMLPTSQGAAVRRPGTLYVAETKASGTARLVPFEFSTVQAYVLEFGNLYVRFYRNGGPIETSPGVPYEVVTPYTAADLPDLQWAQSADVLYLAHPNYAPRKLSRTGHTSWTLTTIAFQDGPYGDQETAITVTPSAASGAVTLTASAALFVSTDVGRTIRLLHGSTWGWARISAFTSSTVVSANVGAAFGATTASAAYRLGVWTAANNPSSVTFWQNRLWWAGTPNEPQTIWGSKTGDFERHSPGTAADDAVAYTVSDDSMNAIRWIRSQRRLLVGTAGGEFALSAGDTDDPVTPTDVVVLRQSTNGAAKVPGITVGSALIYVQRSQRKLMEMAYSFEADNYLSPELTLLAGHITRGKVVEMAWAQEPHRVMWVVLADGSLRGMTYMRDQQVVAWHRHTLGGTNAKVRSVTTIPGTNQTETWFVVERTVGGVTKRFVERLADFFYAEEDGSVTVADAYFVDCGLTYSGVATTSLTGAAHIAGETVQVLAGGAAHPDVTVTGGGGVTLVRSVTKAAVGYSYASEIETLDINAGANDGTAQTRIKRVSSVGMMLFQTLGAKVGWRDQDDVLNLEEVQFRAGDDPMDAPPPLFTGVKFVPVPPRWDREARVVMRQDQPLPLTAVGIVPRMQANE